MCVYTERLRVPLSWWLPGFAVVALLGAEPVAGFGWPVAVAVYAVLGGGYAAALIRWGWARVEVATGELRAGTARLPLTAAGQAAELDQAQTRAICGPQADPAAFVLMRPYLRRAVYIEVTGQEDHAPYWVVGSRRPQALAAAINRSRPGARAGGATVG